RAVANVLLSVPVQQLPDTNGNGSGRVALVGPAMPGRRFSRSNLWTAFHEADLADPKLPRSRLLARSASRSRAQDVFAPLHADGFGSGTIVIFKINVRSDLTRGGRCARPCSLGINCLRGRRPRQRVSEGRCQRGRQIDMDGSEITSGMELGSHSRGNPGQGSERRHNDTCGWGGTSQALEK